MGTGRLEAFSDGVIAVIITIMVLELKPPHGTDLGALAPVLPVFLTYVLSFIYVGIYWNNHHHMLFVSKSISGGVLWANLHLLFWLSLIPFTTAWMGENHFTPLPTALYGAVLFMAALSYHLLTMLLTKLHGKNSTLTRAIGSDFKGSISLVFYALGVALAFYVPMLSLALYGMVAMMWLVPDRRIEDKVKGS